MPYLLPDGDAFEPNLKCAVVFYPDRVEYRRALWGAISQLTKWWMWERDELKRGADAADSWDLAYEATMENFGMLDQILDAIDEVEDLLRALQFIGACCPEVDVTEGAQYTDTVEDGVGDVPQNIVDAGYATDTTDWDSFEDYKCMIAHVLVEDVVQGLTMLAPYVNAAGVIFGGLATVTAIALAIIGSGGTALITGLIGGLGLAAELYELITDRDFVEDAAAAIAACNEDLVCAFMEGDGPADSKAKMDAAADACLPAAYASVFKLWSYPAKVKGLYAGRYDAQDTAQTLADRGYTVGSFDCSCAADFTELTTFGSNNDGLGNWGGGKTLAEEHVTVEDQTTAIQRVDVPDWHTAIRAKITVTAYLPDHPDDWGMRVKIESGGGELTFEDFELSEEQSTHELEYINPTGGDGTGNTDIGFRIWSTNSSRNVFIVSALIEVWQA